MEGSIWGAGWTGAARRAAVTCTAVVAALALVALIARSGSTGGRQVVGMTSAGATAPPAAPAAAPPTAASSNATSPNAAGTPSSATAASAGRLTATQPAGTQATAGTQPAGTVSAADQSPAAAPTEPDAPTTEPATTEPASTTASTAATLPACTTADCVTLDATKSIGPADHADSGLNDSVAPGINGDANALTALDTSMYRGAPQIDWIGQYDWSDWDMATRAGVPTTLILEDMWIETYDDNSPPTPWSDWPAYDSWVTSTVKRLLASGQRIDYWEVYNEPGWNDIYTPSAYATETPQDLLQQFLVTYQLIKAVDPAAQIIGPSIGEWSLTPVPPTNQNHEPDLGTFLRFAAAHRLRLAAVDWHDNAATPAAILADAEATEALIKSLPALGDPPTMLDEFASNATQPIPGWDVGYLAAATEAGFLSANRSCWDTCTGAQLDGILATGGTSKSSEYYERLTYASMKGRMIPTSGNDPDLPALGSYDPATGSVVALLGRDASCGSLAWCNAQFGPNAQPAAPTSVTVRVLVPWRSAHPTVTLKLIPFLPDLPAPAPAQVTADHVSVTPDGAGTEAIQWTIPSFTDGSAYSLTVTPGS